MDIKELEEKGLIFEGWRVRDLIGEGGFGKVYEIAREGYGVNAVSALKVITIPKSSSDINELMSEGMDEKSASEYLRGYVDEFMRECEIMSRLKGNSHIVSFEDYKVVEHTDEVGWDILIRMEKLTPLVEYMKTHQFSREEILTLGISMCDALALCKKQNILHRDVKPANIFISANGDYKLGDFGVSRIIEKSNGASTKVGTTDYLAPEVFRGEAYDGTVDIYSLGLVLYRFFNNNRLPFLPPAPQPITFEQREEAFSKRISGMELPMPAHADRVLYEVLKRACAFAPQDRYQDPEDLKQVLLRLRDNASDEWADEETLPLPLSPERRDEEDKQDDHTVPNPKLSVKAGSDPEDAKAPVDPDVPKKKEKKQKKEKEKKKIPLFVKILAGVLLLILLIAVIRGCRGSKAAGNTASGSSSAKRQSFYENQNREIDFDGNIWNSEADNFVDSIVGDMLSDSPLSYQIKDFETDANIESAVDSGEVTDEFRLYTDDGELLVRAINVCAEPVALKDCQICSVRMTEDSGGYSLEQDMKCGEVTYEQVYNYYSEHNLFKETEDALLYKVQKSEYTFRAKESVLDGSHAAPVFPNAYYERDGIFSFEDGILKEIRLELPELLYWELRSNVDQYELERMSAEELAAIAKQRNDILTQLKEAFDGSGVDVQIDEAAGTIAMSNDILFDVDSAELKPDAKAYIDEFFGIYTSVILSDSLSDTIRGIRFEGHTDTSGDYDHNLTLSKQRAQSVIDYCVRESVLTEEQKSELSRLASAVGYAYDRPVYNEDGEVDMAASRRVEVNFVLNTEYSEEDDGNGDDAAADVVTSSTARGTIADRNFKYIDEDMYTDIVAQHLSCGTPILMSGDTTSFYVGKATSGIPFTFVVNDDSVGRTEKKTTEAASLTFDYYYFHALNPGKTKVIAYGDDEEYNGRYVYMRVVDPAADYPLSLVPNKEVTLAPKFPKANVKFSLCGDGYTGSVMAFTYCWDGEKNLAVEASWIDAVTLSVDLPSESSHSESGEYEVCIILTAEEDLDTVVGCTRYAYTVKK